MLICLLLISVSSFDVTELRIATQSETLTLKAGCNAFHLGTNYQRTELHFSMPSVYNKLKSLRYTDILTEYCSNVNCPKDSAVCGEISNFHSHELIIGACISDLYLYIHSDGVDEVYLNSKYLEGSCDKIEENLYTQCGAMSYSECDKCGDECRLANCIKNQRDDSGVSKQKILMKLCLPSTITSDEVDQRCLGYSGVQFGVWKEDCDDPISIGSVGSVTIIALVVVMMSFFAFVGIVTWYNFRLKMAGNPPIKCFKFCPEILFPKPPKPKPTSYYQPPNIALQSFK